MRPYPGYVGLFQDSNSISYRHEHCIHAYKYINMCTIVILVVCLLVNFAQLQDCGHNPIMTASCNEGTVTSLSEDP